MSSLYEINQQFQELNELIANGEMTAEELADTFESLEMEFSQKVDNICYLIKENIALAKAMKDEETALAERRKAKEKATERLKDYLVNAFMQIGISKQETAKNKVSLRESKAVSISDEAQFNEWAKTFRPDLVTVKVTEAPNKTEIKRAIENGESVEGATIVTNISAQIK